jgi:hypothetical protein
LFGGAVMKYFVLTVAIDEQSSFSHEYYIKGQELDEVVRLMSKYSNGILSTNKFHLCTQNIKFGYVREINLQDAPHIDSREFALINEKNSYDLSKPT